MHLVIGYFFPLAYLVILGWLFWKNNFFRAEGIRPAYSLAFLFGKIATGILYTWVMIRFIPSAKADIDLFFGDGLQMYHQFFEDPAGFPAYLANLFHISDFDIGRTDSDFIRTVFEGIKFIHFLLNFLSGGQLFTNVLLFNGLAAWLFLRCWVYLKRLTGSWWAGGWLFLFPSAFFFTSVILKEGIELSIIAAIIPILAAPGPNKPAVRFILLPFLFILLFFFKYLIAATFCTSLFLYLLYRKWPGQSMVTTLGAFLVGAICFFGVGKIHPALNLPQYIIDRREEFQKLEANTELTMRVLEPNAGSFARALPEALTNVFIRPLPWEVEKIFYYAFWAELYGLWFLLGFLALKAKGRLVESPGPELWAWLFFCLVNLVIIGFTITNTGAIIRYRSIFLPGVGCFLWVLWGGGRNRFGLLGKNLQP